MQPRRNFSNVGHFCRWVKIEFVAGNEPIHSPAHLLVKFVSFGGAKIDAESIKVTYLRSPNVDLTERMKPFVQPTGIDMPDADVPPGDHFIQLDVKDSNGRVGTRVILLAVVSQ